VEQKKTKVMVATNLFDINPIVYSGHLDMFYKLGKVSDEFEIIFHAPWRTPIDRARNDAAMLAIYYECDYLFFYDDDMYFPNGNDILNLLRCIRDNEKINVLQALAFIRGYPFRPMIFKLHDIEVGKKKMMTYDEYKNDVDADGLVKVDAVGCCCTVIDVNLFKLIPKPWFLTGETHTEDIYFCVKASNYTENVGIYCNTNIKIGHLLDKIILVDENREILKKIHDENGLNQLFLPDPTFLPMMSNSKSLAYDFDKRINPLEMDLPLRGEKENG